MPAPVETELSVAQEVTEVQDAQTGLDWVEVEENRTRVPATSVPTAARKVFVAVAPLLFAVTGTEAAPPPKFEFLMTLQ